MTPKPPSKRGLPKGVTVDDVIKFPSEAAIWLGVTEVWCLKRQRIMPGVSIQSNMVKLFHPRTWLDKTFKKI